MPRVKRGVAAHRRHKRILKEAKGYSGARSKLHGVAREAVEKAGIYAYRDRKQKKRTFRALWIARINAAAREHHMSYSVFVSGLKNAGVDVDRKILAQIAVSDPSGFEALVSVARQPAA